MTETCGLCPPDYVAEVARAKATDTSLPLCPTHWNGWLGVYAPTPFSPTPPCAAHLIADGGA